MNKLFISFLFFFETSKALTKKEVTNKWGNGWNIRVQIIVPGRIVGGICVEIVEVVF